MIKTRIVALAVSDDEATDIERRMLAFVKRNLTDLMGLPKKVNHSVDFLVGFNDYMLFVRAIITEVKSGNPIITEFIFFDIMDITGKVHHRVSSSSSDSRSYSVHL